MTNRKHTSQLYGYGSSRTVRHTPFIRSFLKLFTRLAGLHCEPLCSRTWQ